MRNFKELKIWQRGIQIAKMVYEQLDRMPSNTKFELGSQMFKSAISVPSNITEGSSRKSSKDYNRFLEIALGSSFELETQLIILDEITSKKDQSIRDVLLQVDEEQKMIMAFMKKVSHS